MSAFLVGWALMLSLVAGQSEPEAKWAGLLQARKYGAVKSLCTGWVRSSDLGLEVEAQKCLANLALRKGSTAPGAATDHGLGTPVPLVEEYSDAAVDEALEHMDQGLALDGQDISLHDARLHLLIVAGRFDALYAALEDSIGSYKRSDALRHWLARDVELSDRHQIKAAVRFTEILNRHYPNDHGVIGNLGAFHSMAEEPLLALPFLKQAVDLAPEDAIDNWNLGRGYDALGRNAEADVLFQRALTLDPAGRELTNGRCLYAGFVEKKLKDRARACALQTQSCGPELQTACRAAR